MKNSSRLGEKHSSMPQAWIQWINWLQCKPFGPQDKRKASMLIALDRIWHPREYRANLSTPGFGLDMIGGGIPL